MASVVVTQTLDWKLHAFDVLSEYDGNNEAATGPMLVSSQFSSSFPPFFLGKLLLGLVKGFFFLKINIIVRT